MKPFERNVNSQYGAPMGRRDRPISGVAVLEQVPIDSGGYDPGGAYWGIGEPMWCGWNDGGEVYVRAPNWDAAKKLLAAPGCTFLPGA